MKQKIYLMKNDLGLYKIGISKHPSKRANDLSNQSGVRVTLLRQWDSYNAYNTEQILHVRYSKQRKCGEWFKFTNKHIKELDSIINEIDRLIPCSVDYSPKMIIKPKCITAIKDVLKWLARGANSVVEINKIIRSQSKILCKYIKSNGVDKFNSLMAEMIKEGDHVPAQWIFANCYGYVDNIQCNMLNCYVPICTQEDKIRMEVVCMTELAESYEQGALEIRKQIAIKLNKIEDGE